MMLQLRLPLFVGDTRPLVRQLQSMAYGDALVCYRWQVEYLQCGVEAPHFRIFRFGQLVGIVEVSHRKYLPTIWEWLATWLLANGWPVNGGELVEYGAQTTWSARKTGLARLWRVA